MSELDVAALLQSAVDSTAREVDSSVPQSEEPLAAETRQYILVVYECLREFGWHRRLAQVIWEVCDGCHTAAALAVGLRLVQQDLDASIRGFHSGVGKTPASSPLPSATVSPAASEAASPNIPTLPRAPSSSSFRTLIGRNQASSVFPTFPWSLMSMKSLSPQLPPDFRELVAKRERFRCALSGAVDAALYVKGIAHLAEGEEVDGCDAAHLYPHALKSSVRYLSGLMYDRETMKALQFGENVDTPSNAVFMSAGLHRMFGRLWYLRFVDGKYHTKLLGPVKQLKEKEVVFAEPSPNPALVNLHAMFTIVRDRLEKRNLFGAAADEYADFNYRETDDEGNCRYTVNASSPSPSRGEKEEVLVHMCEIPELVLV